MVVGRLHSYWDGLFSGAMLSFGRVSVNAAENTSPCNTVEAILTYPTFGKILLTKCLGICWLPGGWTYFNLLPPFVSYDVTDVTGWKNSGFLLPPASPKTEHIQSWGLSMPLVVSPLRRLGRLRKKKPMKHHVKFPDLCWFAAGTSTAGTPCKSKKTLSKKNVILFIRGLPGKETRPLQYNHKES